MAINRDSNVYTIVFATIMVVVVGGLLAFIASSLKSTQQTNIKNEKMQNILQAIGLDEMKELQRDEAGAKFNDFVKRRITINYKGEIVSDKTAEDEIDPLDKLDAFNIDLRKEYSRFVKPILRQNKGNDAAIAAALSASEDIHFPIFICENNGESFYVLSASGKGLWDDVWGYIGLRSDASTVNGTVFDHKGETPGLGSIITETWFEDQFKGKTIEEDGVYTPLKVLKPGKDLNNHQVDGISGATFTGVGVDEMLGRNLKVYYNFFKGNAEFAGGSNSNTNNSESSSTSNNPNTETEILESDSMSSVEEIEFTGELTSDLDLIFDFFDEENPEYESLPERSPALILQGINFKQASAKLKIEESENTLKLLLVKLKEEKYKALKIQLNGHTHKGPKETLNLSLSEKRAVSVKNYFIENGIDANRIQVKGYGASQLLSDENTKEARVKNRRTEIRIIK